MGLSRMSCSQKVCSLDLNWLWWRKGTIRAEGMGGKRMSRCLKISFSCFNAVERCGSVKFGAFFANAKSSSAVVWLATRKVRCVRNCFNPGLDKLCNRKC